MSKSKTLALAFLFYLTPTAAMEKFPKPAPAHEYQIADAHSLEEAKEFIKQIFTNNDDEQAVNAIEKVVSDDSLDVYEPSDLMEAVVDLFIKQNGTKSSQKDFITFITQYPVFKGVVNTLNEKLNTDSRIESDSHIARAFATCTQKHVSHETNRQEEEKRSAEVEAELRTRKKTAEEKTDLKNDILHNDSLGAKPAETLPATSRPSGSNCPTLTHAIGPVVALAVIIGGVALCYYYFTPAKSPTKDDEDQKKKDSHTIQRKTAAREKSQTTHVKNKGPFKNFSSIKNMLF